MRKYLFAGMPPVRPRCVYSLLLSLSVFKLSSSHFLTSLLISCVLRLPARLLIPLTGSPTVWPCRALSLAVYFLSIKSFHPFCPSISSSSLSFWLSLSLPPCLLLVPPLPLSLSCSSFVLPLSPPSVVATVHTLSVSHVREPVGSLRGKIDHNRCHVVFAPARDRLLDETAVRIYQ